MPVSAVNARAASSLPAEFAAADFAILQAGSATFQILETEIPILLTHRPYKSREQEERDERERAEADRAAALQAAEEARQRRVAEGMEAPTAGDGIRAAQTTSIDTHSVMTPEQVRDMLHATEVTDEPAGTQATYAFILPAQTVGGFDAAGRDEVVRFFKAHGFRGSIHKEEM